MTLPVKRRLAIAKADTPEGAESVLNTVLSAAQSGQERMVRDWSEHCARYARYFSNLSKARGPEDILAANADLMVGGLDALTRGAANLPRLDGADRPAV